MNTDPVRSVPSYHIIIIRPLTFGALKELLNASALHIPEVVIYGHDSIKSAAYCNDCQDKN